MIPGPKSFSWPDQPHVPSNPRLSFSAWLTSSCSRDTAQLSPRYVPKQNLNLLKLSACQVT
jgi:hypothetical protein